MTFSDSSLPTVLPEDAAPLVRSGSTLVRRLVRAEHDPGKERVRAWLCAIDDERLIGFGLAPDDIALLRSARD